MENMGNNISVRSAYSELSPEAGVFQLLLNKCSDWMAFKIFAILLLVLVFLFKRSGCWRLCDLWGSLKRKITSVGRWIGNKFTCGPSWSVVLGRKVLYYCQNDDEDERFQRFCGEFLQNTDISVQKLLTGDDIPTELHACMILLLPNDNRQNNADVLYDLISDNMNKYNLKDDHIKNITLIQISFDGNNAYKPPNLMNEDIFEIINLKIGGNFSSFINITYSDDNNFKHCTVNRGAARELETLWK